MPSWLLLLLTALTASGVASAQDPTDTFWDRLAVTRDPQIVMRILQGEPAATAVHQSLALLRVYEITGVESDGVAAERVIGKALEERPRDAWLQFAMGEVLAVRAPRTFPMRASKYLLEALKIEPQHAPAATALARLALISREKSLLEQARKAGDRIPEASANAVLLTMLADVAREIGQHELALQRAKAAVAADAESATSRYTLAMVQFGNAALHTEAYANYLKAAELADRNLLALIRSELEMIGEKDELPQLSDANASPEQRLNRFWSLRATRDGRTVPERVGEHYRRIAVARDKFRAKRAFGTTPDALYWTSEENNVGFDDRGRVYIRYGEPTSLIRSMDAAGRVKHNETWIYDLPGRDQLIFHFLLPFEAGRGWVLTNVPGCGSGSWYHDRSHLGGEYGLLAAKCGSGSAQAWSVDATVRNLNLYYREQVDLALQSDAHAWWFKNQLTVDADVYAFRSATGQPEFTAAVAIPVVPAFRGQDGQYRVGLRIQMADSVLGLNRLVDTTLVVSQPLTSRDRIRTSSTMRFDSVRSPYYRIVVRAPNDSTSGAAFGGILHAYLTRGFGISDVVLADTTEGGSFRRGNVNLSLIPSRAFAHASFRVFYEIYGLAPETEYETTLKVEPLQQGVIGSLRKLTGRGDVTLSFRGTASGTERWRQQELRTVSAPFPPGDYRMTVTVRDLRTGELIIKNRDFRLVGPK